VDLTPTSVMGAFVVRPVKHEDDRGWFGRVFCAEEFAGLGLSPDVAQVNLAMTARAGTVRGLHYQLPPGGEAKLVRCVDGSIFDVLVDVRPGSDTFGRWFGIELTADAGTALYVPRGCAHGYQALTDGARALYHADTPYQPALERGVHHADPILAIAWPLPPSHVSSKDLALPSLAEADLGPG
jgi:dTDP-4-dehydrorhamnose 3,5-epimerase